MPRKGDSAWNSTRSVASPRLRRRARPVRLLSDDDYRKNVPVHVVWEITLACDLKCLHCGSRAGKPRPDELSTRECLDVVEKLAAARDPRDQPDRRRGVPLRCDWTEIVRAIRSHGMNCSMQTGGRNLNAHRIAEAVEAGLQGVGVSIDGLEPLHDRLRGVPGSFPASPPGADALPRGGAAYGCQHPDRRRDDPRPPGFDGPNYRRRGAELADPVDGRDGQRGRSR